MYKLTATHPSAIAKFPGDVTGEEPLVYSGFHQICITLILLRPQCTVIDL